MRRGRPRARPHQGRRTTGTGTVGHQQVPVPNVGLCGTNLHHELEPRTHTATPRRRAARGGPGVSRGQPSSGLCLAGTPFLLPDPEPGIGATSRTASEARRSPEPCDPVTALELAAAAYKYRRHGKGPRQGPGRLWVAGQDPRVPCRDVPSILTAGLRGVGAGLSPRTLPGQQGPQRGLRLGLSKAPQVGPAAALGTPRATRARSSGAAGSSGGSARCSPGRGPAVAPPLRAGPEP